MMESSGILLANKLAHVEALRYTNVDSLEHVVVVVPFGVVFVSLIFLVTVTCLSGLLILVLAFNLCSKDILLWLNLSLETFSLSLLW